jgi:cytochrome c553
LAFFIGDPSMTFKQNYEFIPYLNKRNRSFRNHYKTLVCVAAAALFIASPVFASDSGQAIKQRIGSGDPMAGNDKTQLCQGCHGERGISTETTIPKLAGQHSAYITKQINDFKSGARKHQIMTAMAAIIDNADIPDIAAYFASQPQMQGTGKTGNLVGKTLFTNGDAHRNIIACNSCHGENGKGDSEFPTIGGQHKNYLGAQLDHWRSGHRTNSPGGIMNNVAKSLTDAEIEALADYISSL